MAVTQRNYSRRYKHTLYPRFRAQCAETNTPCWLCGQPIDYTADSDDYSNGDRFELDHYYPYSTRPDLAEDPANFRAAHADCNRTRGNTTKTHTLAGTLSRDWTGAGGAQ